MPESHSSTRIFFRLQNELAQALDALVPELRQETLGQVTDRSKAARYLLIEAIRTRQRQRQRRQLIEEALNAIEERHTQKQP